MTNSTDIVREKLILCEICAVNVLGFLCGGASYRSKYVVMLALYTLKSLSRGCERTVVNVPPSDRGLRTAKALVHFQRWLLHGWHLHLAADGV